MYGPGAASDEWLTFFPDGTGRIDILNWSWCYSDAFNWRVEGDKLVFDGTVSYDRKKNEKKKNKVEDPDVAVEVKPRLNATLIFKIAEEDTPCGTRMRVLRLSFPDGVTPPEDFWMPDHFGFVREEIDDMKVPNFLFEVEKAEK